MLLVGCKLYIRCIFYIIASCFWGFLFTLMFGAVSGLGYTNGYFLDSLQNSLVMLTLLIVMLEVLRLVLIKKYAKVKQELQKDSNVLFDKPANLSVNQKVFEGWLFLTDSDLIFRSLKKKSPQTLVIPINSINSVDKIKLAAFSVDTNGANYIFAAGNRNRLVELINAKLSSTTNAND